MAPITEIPAGVDARRKSFSFRSATLRMGSFPVLFVVLATLLLYARTLSYRFVYDDNYQILNNSHILSWRYLPVYFTRGVWSQVSGSQSNLYRPFFLVWLRSNMEAFGREPWDWHLTTVLMHGLATWLVYLLALRLLKHRTAAVVAAALFAFHPLQVESVAWISGVTEPLGASLFLIAFLFYLKQREHPGATSVWLALSLVSFSAAVLTKETEVVLPFLILAYEITVGHASRLRGWFMRLVPYFAVFGFYFALRAIATHGASTRGQASLHDVLLSLPWLLCAYFKLLFWPASLSPLYDFPYVNHAASARFFIGLAVLGACLGLAWWTWKRGRRLGTFLCAWFALTLAPAAGAFYLAFKAESYHDRYLYLPLFSLAVFAGWLFRRLALQRGRPRPIAYCAAAMLLGVMAVITYHQQQYWQTDQVLFKHATEVAPRNERACAGYSAELINHGELSRALALSERTMRVHPESDLAFRDAALSAFLLHDFPLAERYYVRAAHLNPADARLSFYLGICRVHLGQYEAAIGPLLKTARLAPDMQMVHYTLAEVFMKLGRWPEAQQELVLELTAHPENASARESLAETEGHLQNHHPE